MESLRPGLELQHGVIDVWSHVINVSEKLRSRDSVSRLFFTTQVMTEKMLGEAASPNTLIAEFKYRMSIEMSVNNVPHNFEGFDMVCFPLLHGDHYYVMNFDLRLAKIVIIDNSGTNVSNLQKYGNIPNILRDAFAEYLKKARHTAAGKIGDATPV